MLKFLTTISATCRCRTSRWNGGWQKTEEERKRLLNIIETHSPQSWASFNMLGEFDFSDGKLQDTTGVLPPKCRSNSSPKIGRRQIDDIYAVSIGYRKSYGGFGTFEPLGPIRRPATCEPVQRSSSCGCLVVRQVCVLCTSRPIHYPVGTSGTARRIGSGRFGHAGCQIGIAPFRVAFDHSRSMIPSGRHSAPMLVD